MNHILRSFSHPAQSVAVVMKKPSLEFDYLFHSFIFNPCNGHVYRLGRMSLSTPWNKEGQPRLLSTGSTICATGYAPSCDPRISIDEVFG